MAEVILSAQTGSSSATGTRRHTPAQLISGAGAPGTSVAVTTHRKRSSSSSSSRSSDDDVAANQRRHQFDVQLTKGPDGLGFSIYCRGRDNDLIELQNNITDDDPRPVNVFIRRLAPGGAAEADGRICADDQVLEVNGLSLIDIPYNRATGVLRNTSGVVRLKFGRRRTSLDTPDAINAQSHFPLASSLPLSSSSSSSPSAAVTATTTTTSVLIDKPSTEIHAAIVPPAEQLSTQSPIKLNQQVANEPAAPRPTADTANSSSDAAKTVMDVNSNDKQCKNRHHTSALRKQLVEIQQRRQQLTDQLKKVNEQITLCSNGGTGQDDAMTDRLVEAETATKKAQRDMISLQASYNVSKTQYTQLETELRYKFNDLLVKYNDTEQIMKQCRQRDDGYTAERDAIRHRMETKEHEYTEQVAVLNEKIRQLENANGGKTTAVEQVRLINRTTLDADAAAAARSSLPTIKTTRSPLTSSSESDKDDIDKAGTASAGVDGRRLEPLGQPVTVLSRFRQTVDADNQADKWSISSDRRFDEEPPSYPPPPPPAEMDNEDAESCSSSSSSSNDEDGGGLEAENERAALAASSMSADALRIPNVQRTDGVVKATNLDIGRVQQQAAFDGIPSTSGSVDVSGSRHQRTGSFDSLEKQKSQGGGMERFKRIFVPKSHRGEAKLTPTNSAGQIAADDQNQLQPQDVGSKSAGHHHHHHHHEGDGKKDAGGHHHKFWKHRGHRGENDKNKSNNNMQQQQQQQQQVELLSATDGSKKKTSKSSSKSKQASSPSLSPAAVTGGNAAVDVSVASVEDGSSGKKEKRGSRLKLKFLSSKSSPDRPASSTPLNETPTGNAAALRMTT